MKGVNKVTMAVVVFVAITVASRYIPPVVNERIFTIYLLVILASVAILFWGIEDISRSGNAAKDTEDGYYTIMSIPIVETMLIPIGDGIGFTPIDVYEAKKNELGSRIAVHLSARYEQEKDLKYYVIPANKIKEKVWPLLKMYHQLEIKDGMVKSIFKPGEYE